MPVCPYPQGPDTGMGTGTDSGPGLMAGNFNEADSHKSFLEALQEWRRGTRAGADGADGDCGTAVAGKVAAAASTAGGQRGCAMDPDEAKRACIAVSAHRPTSDGHPPPCAHMHAHTITRTHARTHVSHTHRAQLLPMLALRCLLGHPLGAA